jgi:uncharacterized membrane protein
MKLRAVYRALAGLFYFPRIMVEAIKADLDDVYSTHSTYEGKLTEVGIVFKKEEVLKDDVAGDSV